MGGGDGVGEADKEGVADLDGPSGGQTLSLNGSGTNSLIRSYRYFLLTSGSPGGGMVFGRSGLPAVMVLLQEGERLPPRHCSCSSPLLSLVLPRRRQDGAMINTIECSPPEVGLEEPRPVVLWHKNGAVFCPN